MQPGGVEVFSSTRLTVPARQMSCKKRAAVRKISTTSLDSGYSLCSTDSEDQVLVINKGLDQCAALLHDILQTDVTEKTLKSHRIPLCKGSMKLSNAKGKKSALKKPTTTPYVYKEKGFLRKSAPVRSCNMNVQKPCVSVQYPGRPTTNCDHVHTEMQHLHRTSSQVPSMSEQGPEASALYNCRLPTSTPALSPQLSVNPQNCTNEGYHHTVPPGGASYHLSPMTTTSAAHTVPSAVHNIKTAVQYNYTDLLSQLNSYKNQIQDTDLLQCVATHLAQLQCSENPGSDQLEHVCEREHKTREAEMSSEEDNSVDMNIAPVRDTSCQTSFIKCKKSPEKTEDKIKTVKYLLGEIKALVADQDDGEALRLVNELEHIMSVLPGVVESGNVHAEIAIALQPLRSENAQLRRRLRILNQQLRDRERVMRSDEQNNKLTFLQSLNEKLQHQFEESQTCLLSLQCKNEEHLRIIDIQKDENRKCTHIIQEKDQEILQIRQQNDIICAKMKTEVGEVLGKMKSVQFKLEASEKENQILEISLRQRDMEVSRLRELTRTLQASMAKLLCDFGKGTARPKREQNLTQSMLDSYEKQLQHDNCPASTSIMNYLQRLESDQVFTSTDRPLPVKTGQIQYSNGVTSDPSDFTVEKVHICNQSSEKTQIPVTPCNLQKHRLELGSESCYLTSDEYKPDETTYLPMASSPHNVNFVSPRRRMCTPPKVCNLQRDSETAYSNRAFSTLENYPEVPKASTNISDALDQITNIQPAILTIEPCIKTASLSKDYVQTYPPILQQASTLEVIDNHPTDHSALDLRTEQSEWTISSFSTFTSHDEQDFRNGLAALDANIAKLQQTLQIGIVKK
ncbi:coiled-coil domain-containing protein 14 isoform X2 [Pseudophryne corroboree]|uniref:coiled-coil domain-containing protein 14 isoform X2 n=3 Tax=Pseudophryne corroboree TaxID=495146 RepID=UPI003081BB37